MSTHTIDAAGPRVAHHFADIDQQREAHTLCMWMFLASEVLFFGGLFTGFAVMRFLQPAGFALAAQQLNEYLGAANTALLLTSSFTMVLAVWASQTKQVQLLRLFLALTIVLGSGFIAIKGAFEWKHEIEVKLFPGKDLFEGHKFDANFALAHRGGHGESGHGESGHGESGHGKGEHASAHPKTVTPEVAKGMEMFFVFYFTITGLHMLHMVVGLVALAIQLAMTYRDSFGIRDYTPIELSGLYWHFVDIVWIFVFPIIYLLRH